MAKTLIIAEHSKGQIKKATLSSITAATKIGGGYSIVVVGKDVRGVADQYAKYGAEKVYTIDNDVFKNYIAENYAEAIAQLIKANNFEFVFGSATAFTKDLLPRLAAKFDAGMASDVLAIEVSGSDVVFARPMWAGNAIAHIKITSPIKFATIRATEFDHAKEVGSTSPVESFSASVDPAKAKVEYIEFAETKSERPELTEARVVVSGGRGAKGPEGFKMLEELADLLNAAIGASRAAVDAGWVPNDLQVGQTGKIVAPELYIACGISGAIQHLAGMKGSKVIVAINKDEEAPIFQVADYGLVADMFKAVPEMIAAIKSSR